MGSLTNKTSPDNNQDYDEGTQGHGYGVTQDLLCFCVQRDTTLLHIIVIYHM